MKIRLTSVFVEDQAKAQQFYTGVLGLVTKHDLPLGEFRWLTVVSAEEPGGVELLLEPNNNPAAQTFQAALHAQGIPALALFVDDLQKEYARLTAAGVTFTQPPTQTGPRWMAVLDDTCGNLIQLHQV